MQASADAAASQISIASSLPTFPAKSSSTTQSLAEGNPCNGLAYPARLHARGLATAASRPAHTAAMAATTLRRGSGVLAHFAAPLATASGVGQNRAQADRHRYRWSADIRLATYTGKDNRNMPESKADTCADSSQPGCPLLLTSEQLCIRTPTRMSGASDSAAGHGGGEASISHQMTKCRGLRRSSWPRWVHPWPSCLCRR